ncbi:hypothetical protein MMC08_004012 [Hypocenomyce scalaris]|nr:hypothetical protein [Hypocenomyce scalaris]
MSSSKPKSAHVADLILQPFLSSTFDPTAYLNSALPPLAISSTIKQPSQALSLSELAAQTQTHISQLSAQTSRLSDALTQLTDDILRSGSRLAYEVEILRGEATSLTEALTEGPQGDITKFVPEGLIVPSSNKQTTEDAPITQSPHNQLENGDNPTTQSEPPQISHLRTLTLVRQRLDAVIHTFDLAMSWPLPPSLTASSLSLPSSLISVSAPDPTTSNISPSQEEKGQEVARKLRDEISNLILSDAGEGGIESARLRVEELRDLAGVWKGTAEERARVKFVEGLAKMIEEEEVKRQQQESARVSGGGRNALSTSQMRSGTASSEIERTATRAGGEGGSGPSFLRNLQRLRDEIYLE